MVTLVCETAGAQVEEETFPVESLEAADRKLFEILAQQAAAIYAVDVLRQWFQTTQAGSIIREASVKNGSLSEYWFVR